MSHLDETTRYAITVEGTLDDGFGPALADWCGPVTLTPAQSADGAPNTILSGIVADQAALVGLVRRLHGLGIVLLYVERCR
jgi:hypothetical protein